jgi:hypothetical protein
VWHILARAAEGRTYEEKKMIGRTIFAFVAILLLQFPIASDALSGPCNDAVAKTDAQMEKSRDVALRHMDELEKLIDEEGVGQKYYDGMCKAAKERVANFEKILELRKVVDDVCRDEIYTCDAACTKKSLDDLQAEADSQCKEADEQRSK